MLYVPIPLPEAYRQHLNHASSRGAKAKQSSCSFWLHPSRPINWLACRGYRYSYLLVRMREKRCWYLCCTVTRPLGSRAWPRKSAETTGFVFAANQGALLVKWSATLHPFVHLLLLFLLFGDGGCVAKYKIQNTKYIYQRCNSGSDILGFRMPHSSYDKPPIAGLIAAARFCLGLPTGHISAVYRTKYCYIYINCTRTAQYMLVPLLLAFE